MAKPKRASAGKRKSKQRSTVKAAPRVKVGGLRARQLSQSEAARIGGLNTLSGVWGAPPPGLRTSSFRPDIGGLPTNVYTPDRPFREANVGVVGLPPAANNRISSFTPDIGGLPADVYSPAETAVAQAAARPVRPSVPPTNAAMASPDVRMGPTFGLPGLSDYERSRLAQADARISPAQRQAIRDAKIGSVSLPAAEKNARLDIGGIRAPTQPNKQTERLQPTTVGGPPAEVAAAQPDRLAGTSVPGIRTDVQTASTAPATISKPTATGAMVDARHPAMPAAADPTMANVDSTFDDRYDVAANAPNVAVAADDAVDAANTDIAPDVETSPAITPDATDDLGTYPDAPPEIEATPNRDLGIKVAKSTLGGLLGGGIPGAVLGGATGLVQGLLSRQPGFDAVVPDSMRTSTGTGLRGIGAAMAGPKGAQGFSLSNPGMSYTSLGPSGQGLRRSDRFGWTEVVGPSGEVRGIRYDNPDKKGLLGKVSNYFDSRYGGQRSMSSISPGAARAIGAGRGGLY